MLTITVFMMSAMLHSPRWAPQRASAACLHHSATERADQASRRAAALMRVRLILSAESAYSFDAGGSYGGIEQMVAHNSLEKMPDVPGFEVHLDVLDRAFWLEVVDKIDPCGFRFISNQNGVIFHA